MTRVPNCGSLHMSRIKTNPDSNLEENSQKKKLLLSFLKHIADNFSKH